MVGHKNIPNFFLKRKIIPQYFYDRMSDVTDKISICGQSKQNEVETFSYYQRK